MGKHRRGRHRRSTSLRVQAVRLVGAGGLVMVTWVAVQEEDPPPVAPVGAALATPSATTASAPTLLQIPDRIEYLPLPEPSTAPPTTTPPPTTTTTPPPRATTKPPAPKTAAAPKDVPKAETPGVAAAARSFLGLNIPYLWGGKSTAGFDCSGYIWAVLKKAGHDVPYRTSGALKSWAVPVSRSEAGPGDLVFWPGHAAIYAGDGRIYDSGTRLGVAERAIWGSPSFGRIP